VTKEAISVSPTVLSEIINKDSFWVVYPLASADMMLPRDIQLKSQAIHTILSSTKRPVHASITTHSMQI
jgi:hypothetical protein